jgi:hypothetical protein
MSAFSSSNTTESSSPLSSIHLSKAIFKGTFKTQQSCQKSTSPATHSVEQSISICISPRKRFRYQELKFMKCKSITFNVQHIVGTSTHS